MISRNQLKYIRQLSQKKQRLLYKHFIVEGDKMVRLAIKQDMNVRYCLSTADWSSQNLDLIQGFKSDGIHFNVTEKEMKTCSQLNTSSPVLAVLEWKQVLTLQDLAENKPKRIIYLDDVRDPGNVGTMIRIADWFGWDAILCSPNSVEWYNPKVVQSTMGSIFRYHPCTADVMNLISEFPDHKLIAADMLGEKPGEVFSEKMDKIILAFGNESKGISPQLAEKVHAKVTIEGNKTRIAESLNVANSSAILLYIIDQLSG